MYVHCTHIFYWRSFLRKKKIHDKEKYVLCFLNGSLNYICFYNHRYLCFSLYRTSFTRFNEMNHWSPVVFVASPPFVISFPWGFACTSLCVLPLLWAQRVQKIFRLIFRRFFFFIKAFWSIHISAQPKTCLMHKTFTAKIMNVWKRSI